MQIVFLFILFTDRNNDIPLLFNMCHLS